MADDDPPPSTPDAGPPASTQGGDPPPIKQDAGPPLIKQQLPAGMRARLPTLAPHYAYVLAYRTGELRAFAYPPRRFDRGGSAWCYIVDTAPRATSGTLKIPTGAAYSFVATYDAQWRVVDPNQVVRGNVVRGEPTVSGFLTSRLRPLGRQFNPGDAWKVEEHVNATLGVEAEARGVPVGNGIALIALAVQVAPDPRVVERVVADEDHAHQVKRVEQETRRLRALLEGDGDAIAYHLAKNPDDTQAILQMITESRDKSERLRLEWLDRMRADDAIQEADYEQARAAVLGGSTALPSVQPNRGFGSWSNTSRPVIDATPPDPPVLTGGRPEPDAPAPDPGPFAVPKGRGSWLDGGPGDDVDTPPDAWPAVPPAPPSVPAPPRNVRAGRFDSSGVVVRWSGDGDVGYRVRRQDDDGQWQVVVACTKATWIEDTEAPDGAVPVYAVSAAAVDGTHSAEAFSDA